MFKELGMIGRIGGYGLVPAYRKETKPRALSQNQQRMKRIKAKQRGKRK